MSNKSTLFILKRRENYNFTEEGYSDKAYDSISTGMFNSSRFVNDMLIAEGVSSNLTIVTDNNDIDREVTAFRPSHVIIEGFWVVPEKFDILKALHPTVTWIVRCHSELPFLAQEGVAIDWTLEYLDRGIFVSGNSKRIQREIRSIARSCKILSEADLIKQTPLLTNCYPTNFDAPIIKPILNTEINIGCFGAIRPMKNQLMQAISAIEFAEANNLVLKYHINANRIEMNGANALRNIKSLFEKQPIHTLVEHQWEVHEDFLELVSQMDICLQISFTETFNIVAADSVFKGIPVVVSKEVAWASRPYADPTSFQNIVSAIQYVFENGLEIATSNQNKLLTYLDNSKTLWIQYIKNDIVVEFMNLEHKIPDNGTTSSALHHIYIALDSPVPSYAVVVVYRNGVRIGVAYRVDDSYKLFLFDDTTPTGSFSYTSKVVIGIKEGTASESYAINVVE